MYTIGLGILFTLQGNSIVEEVKPIAPPTNTKGTEIPNQNNKSITKFPKGIPPELSSAHKNMLIKKNTKKQIPENKQAVDKELTPQFTPPNALNSLVETYPATIPKNIYSIIAVVIKDPLEAGDKKPKQAKTRVITRIQKRWEPVPITEQNKLAY